MIWSSVLILGLGALVSAGRETKMPIKSEFWHILQKHIALRKRK